MANQTYADLSDPNSNFAYDATMKTLTLQNFIYIGIWNFEVRFGLKNYPDIAKSNI